MTFITDSEILLNQRFGRDNALFFRGHIASADAINTRTEINTNKRIEP